MSENESAVGHKRPSHDRAPVRAGTRARTIRARDHRVTVTARALVSSQNDSSRTDNCALLVTLYWTGLGVCGVRRCTLGSNFGLHLAVYQWWISVPDAWKTTSLYAFVCCTFMNTIQSKLSDWQTCIFASSREFTQKWLRGSDLYDRTGQRNRTQFIASASSQ